MTILESVILGIVQGLTEFLPISSSGHLIIARELFSITESYSLGFDAVLQLATTLAVLVYFRKDIWKIITACFRWVSRQPVEKKEKVLVGALAVGTIPAVILGLYLEEFMETVFRSGLLVIVTLVAGALVMLFAERVSKQYTTSRQLSVGRGLLVGLFQSLALVPGMSRSGMTISGGLFLGLSREEATRFSFLLAFPILLGSGLKKLLDLYMDGALSVLGGELVAGAFVSFIVGLGAIHFLITFLKTHTLHAFIWYRLALAVILIALYTAPLTAFLVQLHG